MDDPSDQCTRLLSGYGYANILCQLPNRLFQDQLSGSNVGPLDPGTHQGIQVLPACACSHWARGRVPSLLGLLLHRLLLWGLGGGLDPLQPLSSGGRLPLEAFGHWLGKSF